MVHFWASEVTESKAAVVKVPEGFVLNVCNATLASDASSAVSLSLETTQLDRKAWKGVVAHLGAAAHAHQVKLDLVFGGAAPQVKFYVAKGTGKINLTGYFQPGPPADLFDAAPVATTATAAATPASKQQSKKRARDEPSVTWDQAASESDSDDEPTTASKPAVVVPKQQQQQPKKKHEQPKEQQKKQQPQQQPQQTVTNGSSTSAADSAAKKKHRKKNKNATKATA